MVGNFSSRERRRLAGLNAYTKMLLKSLALGIGIDQTSIHRPAGCLMPHIICTMLPKGALEVPSLR
jgi:hypothetical protein